MSELNQAFRDLDDEKSTAAVVLTGTSKAFAGMLKVNHDKINSIF